MVSPNTMREFAIIPLDIIAYIAIFSSQPGPDLSARLALAVAFLGAKVAIIRGKKSWKYILKLLHLPTD